LKEKDSEVKQLKIAIEVQKEEISRKAEDVLVEREEMQSKFTCKYSEFYVSVISAETETLSTLS
jgi:hypothetical protein